MYLINYQDKVGTIIDKKVNLQINGENITGNEEYIFNKVIQGKSRLLFPYPTKLIINFKSESPAQDVVYGMLVEYPSCCGKLILHTIHVHKNIMVRNDKGLLMEKTLSDKQFTKVLEAFIDLTKEISKTLLYSSISFIISRKEQPMLHEAITKLGFKPINTFANQRMNLKNICDDYVINLEY